MADISELLGRTLVLVAHPDDETVGCGALLQRIAEPIVVFATDGAPHDQYFWDKYGSRLRYQRIREEEARQALSIIGVNEIEFFGNQPSQAGEGIADQSLHEHLFEAYEMLQSLITRHRLEAILTLAYEGGHPDHDCCSILGARLGIDSKVPVWEIPLYRRYLNGELVHQGFLSHGYEHEEVQLDISPEESKNKRAMLDAYASQHPFLLEFDAAVERFRPQPKYDYTRRPHEGLLNYEAWGWTIKGEHVCNAHRNFTKSQSEVAR